ncbi:hypothetical protein CapIbe_010873 [Capra ibex]
MLPPHADLEGSLWAGKIEHQVTPEELQHLNALFQEYEKRGRQLLDMEIFKCIMKQSMRSRKKNSGPCLARTESSFQYLKVTFTSFLLGYSQDGFCTYLWLVYSEQADARARQ